MKERMKLSGLRNTMTKLEILEKLNLQLDYLNKRSKRFLWYVYEAELFELNKKTERLICWCHCSTIKDSYFSEDNDDKLLIDFGNDADSIILDSADGGYI